MSGGLFPGPEVYPSDDLYPDDGGDLVGTTLAQASTAHQPRHALSIKQANGTVLRFGPDEPYKSRRLLSISTATELPGGFSAGSFVVSHPSRLDPSPAQPFADVTLYDADTDQTLYEGRVTGTPQTGTEEIEIQTEGHAKRLEDDETARMIFYDRDLSSWQSASAQRQLNLLSGGVAYTDPSTVWDFTTGSPGVSTANSDPWSPANGIMSEAWYDANGLSVGGVDYAWRKNANVSTAVGPPTWAWVVSLTVDDTGSSPLDTSNLRAAGPGAGSLTSAGAAVYKFVRAYLYYNAAVATGAQNTYEVLWTLLAVFGNHGLPLQGTPTVPNTGRGLLGSDMIEYIVKTWAGGLTTTSGSGGSIEPTSFVVPHLVFSDPTTARAMIEAITVFGGNSNYPLDWGCYDGKKFFARSPGTYGRSWRVRRDQTASEGTDGPDSSLAVNGVMVQYDDGSGTTHTIGPVGSGADTESAFLTDTSPTNPANFNSGQKHWKYFDAGITSVGGASLVGQLVLAWNSALFNQWRGSITVTGQATDSGGQPRSAGLIRAGDTIVVEDDNDTRPRRVATTSYDGSTCQASIGQEPDKLDVLLAKAGVVVTGRLG